MKNRTISTAVFTFSDGTFVKWEYLGKVERLYKAERRWKISLRVEQSPSIEQFFETWDKPSQHTAEHLIRNAIKDAKL